MVQVTIDTSELLRWSAGLKAIPKVTNARIARALNQLGSELSAQMANSFARAMNLPTREVHRMFEIKKATPDNLWWKVDISEALSRAPSTRPLPQRKWDKRRPDFPPGMLVNVITAGDVKVEGGRLVEVCEICEQKAEEGPYTIEEVRAMGAKWEHFAPRSYDRTNLFHPGCRCTVWPFQRRWAQVSEEFKRHTGATVPNLRSTPPGRVTPFHGTPPQVMTFEEFARKMTERAGKVAVDELIMGIQNL